MGMFSSLFGSPSDKYSQIERPLSELKIRELVSKSKVISLSQAEEALVEQTLIKARMGNGKISMRKIDQILRKLMNTHKISLQDKQGLIKVFNRHYTEKFGK